MKRRCTRPPSAPASPGTEPLALGLSTLARPRGDEGGGPSRIILEDVEEVPREPPHPGMPLLGSCVLCVAEEMNWTSRRNKKPAKEVRELKAALSSVMGRIEVSRSTPSITTMKFSFSCLMPQSLTKTSEHRRRLLDEAAPVLAKNKRLQASVEALDASLTNAQNDNERLQLRVLELEAENRRLVEQFKSDADQRKGKSLLLRSGYPHTRS